ncbi:2OG-Fe(II) oxygenase [Mycena maculata]|uniref:2OG-Fe(II) oxygenase n=1 Tax=Mycena maculata TaxID=230809 RepID=A0AAD7JYM8_9AGAR|nr:2OG-Fe(II) oxygenase [Mycena maculata]
MSTIPVIDCSALFTLLTSPPSPEALATAREVYVAASTWGFFQLTHHPVPPQLQFDLLTAAQTFFALPEEEKLALDVRNGGVAWRGYMPPGGEGTHGRTDHKEGIYFGPEHPDTHALVGMPLHGKNQFPSAAQVPGMQRAILEYIAEITKVGVAVVAGLSLGLGLEAGDLKARFLEPEPVALFRCFKYATLEADVAGEETYGNRRAQWFADFGLLTILKQASAGLQVKSPQGDWVDVPVLDNAFVVNVGDMLDQLTGGRLPSRAHRVLPPPPSAGPRYSFPFFFDFAWTAPMVPLDLAHLPPLSAEEQAAARERWHRGTFKKVEGYWWQYLAKKVQKVFPDLALPDFEANEAPSTRFTRPVPTAKVVA